MKYMGSKARISKRILEIIPTEGRNYVEPFAGGMNMMSSVLNASSRWANDSNSYVIAMFEALLSGWVPPKISKEQHNDLRKLSGEDKLIGWAGTACSFSGAWFGGYAGVVKTKDGIRDYQAEAWRNVEKQISSLNGVIFSSVSYEDMDIPDGSLVYCDPPYANTTGYKDKFNSKSFWRWAKRLSRHCDVYVSEYVAPDYAHKILTIPIKSSLSANGNSGGCKNYTEKLFKL